MPVNPSPHLQHPPDRCNTYNVHPFGEREACTMAIAFANALRKHVVGRGNWVVADAAKLLLSDTGMWVVLTSLHNLQYKPDTGCWISARELGLRYRPAP